MIKKMSSQEFNDILEETKDKIITINNDIYKMKNDMQNKIKVIKYNMEYFNSCLSQVNSTEKKEGSFIFLNNNYKGLYESYGDYVHAAYKSTPINLFNIIPINTNKIHYTDETFVAINNIQNDQFKNILKSDSIEDKDIFFEEYISKEEIVTDNDTNISYLSKDNKINITITINKEKTYGISKFNIIEFDPYLMRSFDIETINIYDTSDTTPSYTLSNIQSDKQHIILDKKYLFNKVEFIIIPKYYSEKDNNKIIPFGLNHIYFLLADFRNDSYIELPYFNENFIDYIDNKCILYTSKGEIETTLTELGIKIYLDKVNGILTTEQQPSSNIKNTIVRNLNQIYFKVPLGNTSDVLTYNNSIYGIRFFVYNR